MPKRIADTQLNKDNFDKESSDEETEQNNEFQPASAEVVQNRVFARAKRRLASSNTEENKNIFSGFTGFSSLNTGGNTKSSSIFNFGSSINNQSPKKTPTFELNKEKDLLKSFVFNDKLKTQDDELQSETESQKVFANNLTSLNKSFYQHISKYSDDNSNILYDFTAVCKEYIDFFKKIKETPDLENSQENIAKNETKSHVSFAPSNADMKPFSFGVNSSNASVNKTSFAFNAKLFSNNSVSNNAVSFSTLSPNKTAENEVVSNKGEEDEGEESIPKVELVEHQEKNSVFTKKCKLYYKKDNAYIEKGVGFLYIKADNSKSSQLLIRAATSTGNILLNIALIKSIPLSKAEKKGVLITCLPNPPLEIKKNISDNSNDGPEETVTFLIRVKQTDIDEVYDALSKYKNF